MWELVRANQRRSTMLVIAMAFVLAALGYAIGHLFLSGEGWSGLALAVILWAVLAAVTYASGDSIVLALSRARRIEKQHHPVLYNIVEEMTIAAGLPQMPAIYIIDDPAPNAFATGRTPQKAAVAVTAGLLETLSRDELQGVIAHELAHIKNRDVLYMTTLTVMVGTIVILAAVARHMIWFGGGRRRTSRRSGGGGQAEVFIAIAAVVLMILAPLIARLLYFAASRRREYVADGCAALFTRYPEGLASALEKISRTTRSKLAAANEATAPMYLVNPLKVSKAGLANLSATHPPIEERIRILRSMGGEAGLSRYDSAYRQITGRAVGVVPASHRDGQVTRARAAARREEADRRQRVRQATDALWQLNDFIFVPCACGTKLKVPPELRGRSLACPHCGREHAIQ